MTDCPCGHEHCRDQQQAAWYDGFTEGQRVAAHALMRSGTVEAAALTERLLVESRALTR